MKRENELSHFLTANRYTGSKKRKNRNQKCNDHDPENKNKQTKKLVMTQR